MTKYNLDPAAFREHLLNAPWMVEHMRARAERGKAVAEATAPVESGEYKSSFSVDAGTNGGIHHDRAEATLSSGDPAALSIEFGHTTKSGSHVDGSYTLTRSLDAMGG